MSKAKNRPTPSGYVERHHALPKAWGGTEADIVILTAREHFIAHLLLAKAHPTSNMVHAAFKLACVNRSRGTKINSRVYEMLRKLHAERAAPIAREANKQKVICPHCNKVGGIAIMRRWHFDFCLHNPNALPRKTFKRTPHSAEHRAKIARAYKERLQNGWESPLKGKKQNANVVCEHCGKIGPAGQMSRWHGANCKMLKG